MSDFNVDNAVAVTSNAQGVQPTDTGSFSVDNAVPVSVDKGKTAFQSFSSDNAVPEQETDQDESKHTPLNEDNPQDKKAPRGTSGSWNENFFNATLHAAEGATWKTVGKPLGIGFDGKPATSEGSKKEDEYLAQLDKEHPIASVIGGSAPYIMAAPLFPQSLLPNIYLRTSAMMGSVGLLNSIGKERVDEPNKTIGQKALTIAKDTAEGAAYGTIFAKAQALKVLDRPFATALARAGVIGAGTATMSTFFGDNLTQAFKQGGILGALSLITEAPHLANTVIGRGIISHANTLTDKAKIDPQSPDLPKQVNEVAKELGAKVKGLDQPHIIAATVKLNDGTEIHGVSHDDALDKIGSMKINSKKVVSELNDYIGGLEPSQLIKTDEGGYTRLPSSWPEFLKDKDYTKSELNNIFGKFLADKKLTDNQQKIFDKVLEDGKPELQSMMGIRLGTEGKDYQAGFTVVDPNGKTRFITREESKQKPFNLPNGHSEDVKGLNESKFMAPPKELEIVNPETLKTIAGNEGKIDINMVPGTAEAAEILKNSHDELKEKFAPYQVGKEGAQTAEILRENLGVLARNNDRLEQSLSQDKRLFDKANKESSLDFIYRLEEGKEQETKELSKIAAVLRDLMDTKRDEVIGLGTGKLENWIENYYPHVWEKADKVGNVIKRMMGRRPFEGSKGFLKKRTIPTMREGVEAGFTPVSYNPVDSAMLRVREMERYIMAHRTIQALKEQGIVKFVGTGKEIPEDFVKIDDRFADVTYKNDKKETVIAGKYYAQKDAARILNNYLSPGLRGKSYIYDMYRGAGNTLNQFQLGLSAFHLGFTSMDATISKFALGINKLSTGDFAGGIKEFGKAPFAPITNILQGRQLLQSWYGKDNGELTNTIADLMASAGGRAKMDTFYATGMKESMMKSLKEGKIVTVGLKVPFYIVEQVARPIMEYIVPRQKMGVFMDMMKMEMERNPGMSHDQMRGIAQRAWNSVDNRMGQLVYDNLFWNHVTKDLAMASVRSLGWNLGTIRELGGGVKDVFGNVQDVIHGKGTKLSYRTAYVMALPIVTGLYGAIYQYLHTGKGPQELKDYFFPKNGGIDNKGQDARVSLPTYMKDVYHYTTNPVQTVINKFSPVNDVVLEMLNNKDYYGTEIRNVDDPAMQQILDEANFIKNQFTPFGFSNQGRDTRTSIGSKIEPFIGIAPAPYDINMTKAEKEAYELEKGKIPVGSRTKEQAEHSKTKAKLRSDFMESKDKGPLDDAVDQGIISSKEKNQIIKESKMTNLQRMTQHLTFEEVEHIMKSANDDEKSELQKIADKKRLNKENAGTWTDAEEILYGSTKDY